MALWNGNVPGLSSSFSLRTARAPKNSINIRILHVRPEAQERVIPETMVCQDPYGYIPCTTYYILYTIPHVLHCIPYAIYCRILRVDRSLGSWAPDVGSCDQRPPMASSCLRSSLTACAWAGLWEGPLVRDTAGLQGLPRYVGVYEDCICEMSYNR